MYELVIWLFNEHILFYVYWNAKVFWAKKETSANERLSQNDYGDYDDGMIVPEKRKYGQFFFFFYRKAQLSISSITFLSDPSEWVHFTTSKG